MVTAEGQGPGQAAGHLKKAVCAQRILDERGGEYLPTLPPGRWGPSLREMQSVGTMAGGPRKLRPPLWVTTWQSTLPQELLYVPENK